MPAKENVITVKQSVIDIKEIDQKKDDDDEKTNHIKKSIDIDENVNQQEQFKLEPKMENIKFDQLY